MGWDAWLRRANLGKTSVKAPGILFDVSPPVAAAGSPTPPTTDREAMRRRHPDREPEIGTSRAAVAWFEVLLRSLLKRPFTRDSERGHLRVLLVENPNGDASYPGALRLTLGFVMKARWGFLLLTSLITALSAKLPRTA